MSNICENPVLTLDQVSLTYFDGDRTTYALQDVSIEIPKKQFIGIMGPSGSGKSSLLYILSGLKPPTSGEASFEGQKLTDLSMNALTDLRRNSFGFVFQQPWLLPWQTALENTVMGAVVADSDSYGKSLDMLRTLGVEHIARKMPSQMSGGEKQRVCVARAMMNNPAVIFADEPTASLDHKNGSAVIKLLADYRQNATVIVVTHDAEMLDDADRVLIMRDGKAVDWLTPSEIKNGSLASR